MFIRFTKQGLWWLIKKIHAGQLLQYSFVWPMVAKWFEDQVKEKK